MRRGAKRLAILAMLAPAAGLAAQSDPLGVALGKRIRATYLVSSDGRDAPVTTGDRTRRLTGSLLRLDGDTLFMMGERRSGEIAILRGGLRRVEISTGRRTRTGHGAALGALIGAGAGVASGVVLCQVITSCDSSGGEFTGVAALGLGVLGGVAGIGIGAIAGSFAHTDRWRPIRPGAIGVPRPGAEGIRLGLSIGF